MVALAATACSNTLEVKTPDIVQPSDLSSAARLATLRAGAFGDFAKAYGGDATASDGQETQILATGMLSDEFKNTDTDPERIAYDARRSDPTGVKPITEPADRRHLPGKIGVTFGSDDLL